MPDMEQALRILDEALTKEREKYSQLYEEKRDLETKHYENHLHIIECCRKIEELQNAFVKLKDN